MRCARRQNVPALPATLNALGEMLDEHQNLVKCNDHPFFQESIVDDHGKCHIMFACPEVINEVVLNGGIEMHADATFKVVPSIPKCYQLFNIHMIIQNHVRSFYFNSTIGTNIIVMHEWLSLIRYSYLLFLHCINCTYFVSNVQSIPVCYVLMESKTQVAYQKVITHFKTIFPNIQPSKIMTDFEIGLRNAFTNVYPNAEIVACFFHYVQASI